MSNFLVQVKVWGKYACFTRPENKVERLSYPIITPSAAKGVLEAIYWKPQFRWEVTEIGILPHPEMPEGQTQINNFMLITLNELAGESQDKHPQEYIIEKHRVQRTCMILRWPCYVIRAKPFIFCDTTNNAAIKRQFDDRVLKGQCYYQPFMGLRQFAANFGPYDEDEKPMNVALNIGLMTHSAVRPETSKKVHYRFAACVPEKWERGFLQIDKPEVMK